jgi:Carbamoyltransferase N-terminus
VTAILGLNAYHGDAAAALVVDGQLVAAAEEERFNRIKHVAGFPSLAARWCLEKAGIPPEELDHIAVSRDPRANVGQKLLRTIRHGASARYLKARLQNAAKIRDVRTALAEALELDPAALRATVHNVEHHQAHVASAFFVSPFEEAAILSVDGFGDFASTMTAVGRGNSFEVLDRVLFPHSLGIFYAAFTQWLGFPFYGDEGKVMGLAPYGDPEPHMKAMRDVVHTHGDVFELNLDYFTHDKEGVDMTWDEGSPRIGTIFSEKLVETFGPARQPDGEMTKHYEDVASSTQKRLEEVYLHMVARLQERTGLTNLCLAGGVALGLRVCSRVPRHGGTRARACPENACSHGLCSGPRGGTPVTPVKGTDQAEHPFACSPAPTQRSNSQPPPECAGAARRLLREVRHPDSGLRDPEPLSDAKRASLSPSRGADALRFVVEGSSSAKSWRSSSCRAVGRRRAPRSRSSSRAAPVGSASRRPAARRRLRCCRR